MTLSIREIPQTYEVVSKSGLAVELARRSFKGRFVCSGVLDGLEFVEFLNYDYAMEFQRRLLSQGNDALVRESPYGAAYTSNVWDSFR